MKNKKFLLIPSIAIVAVLVATPIGITWASGEMMNGMMMDAMNSSEGEKMMNACQDFMFSNSGSD